MKGKGAAWSTLKNVSESSVDYYAYLETIRPLYEEYEALIAQIRDIDQFAFFAIQNTWDLRDTTMIRRAGEGQINDFHNLQRASTILRGRIHQLRQRISSLTTPRRLDFTGGKLSKKQKAAIGTISTLTGLAGLAYAYDRNEKPKPFSRIPQTSGLTKEETARMDRQGKRMQQLEEAQQRAWERSLYPTQKFYDAETW